MAARSDRQLSVPEAQACEICGISQQRCQQWAARGLFSKAATPRWLAADVVALAQLAAIINLLGPSDGATCWAQVQTDLAASPARGRNVYVVFDLQYKKGEVVNDIRAIGPTVAHGRPNRVLALGALKRDVTAAFRRAARG